jgi:hypothetical protein
MKTVGTACKLLAVALSSALQAAPSFAQGAAIVGTWRTMIGSPSTYGQPSSSVVFTTTFNSDGTYRTIAVVEGGNGYQGAGGAYVMTGHYSMQPPATLRYRLENSVLCVLVNVCKPGLPPGERLGAVVSVGLQFEGASGFVANGQRWTRLQ